jgi:hypothetical protein
MGNLLNVFIDSHFHYYLSWEVMPTNLLVFKLLGGKSTKTSSERWMLVSNSLRR